MKLKLSDPSDSQAFSSRSKRVKDGSTSRGAKERPGRSMLPLGAFYSANITWNSGLADRWRWGRSSSTSSSKGKSWWA